MPRRCDDRRALPHTPCGGSRSADWSDAFGRKRAFLGGVALFLAASAACAAAPSIPFLVGARAVQGFGAALLLPASLGLLLPEFPPEKRHIAIGAWAAVGGIAAAAGPPLGGLLVEVGWRWVFIVNVPVGIAGLIFGARVLREIRHPDSEPADVLGALLLTAGVGALTVAIVQGESWGWSSARVLGLLAAAALLLAGVGRRIATHPAPIVDPALLRVRAWAAALGPAGSGRSAPSCSRWVESSGSPSSAISPTTSATISQEC